MATKGQRETTLTPKLRFPEFKELWDEVALNDLAVPISDRVGGSECVPYTVTSGVGLVSQNEKFGRTIAGNSLSNYILLRKDDFAYNKSATKAFPEGYVARYREDAKAAVPNSIFTCFRADPVKIDPAYLDFLFAGNLHGRWLRKFLTIGARAHGSLNVNDDDLMAMPVPRPSPAEQRKIAACLTSLDDLLAAEGRNLEALRVHKKALMQQLFPRPGEARPRLRFPEFRDAAEWKEHKLEEVAPLQRGFDLPSDQLRPGSVPVVYSNGIRAFHESGMAKAPGLVTGRSGTMGKLHFIEDGDYWPHNTSLWVTDFMGNDPRFVFCLFEAIGFERFASGSGVPTLNRNDAHAFVTHIPSETAEQQRIAACLSSLDDLIAAVSRKRDGLRAHKKGLMQQLLPSPKGL